MQEVHYRMVGLIGAVNASLDLTITEVVVQGRLLVDVSKAPADFCPRMVTGFVDASERLVLHVSELSTSPIVATMNGTFNGKSFSGEYLSVDNRASDHLPFRFLAARHYPVLRSDPIERHVALPAVGAVSESNDQPSDLRPRGIGAREQAVCRLVGSAVFLGAPIFIDESAGTMMLIGGGLAVLPDVLKMTPPTLGALLATIMVVIGVADLPYGYYVLLRLFLCGFSLFLLFGSRLARSDWQSWALGGLAFLYNPVVPVQLGDKGLWVVANVATVAVFWEVLKHEPDNV